MTSHCQFYYDDSSGGFFVSFKILKNNCCGLDVHKTWIYACIGISDSHSRTEYKHARFSSFSKGLQELCDWLAKYHCTDVCLESTGKYWIPVFNILEKNNIWITLSHPKYTKPQKGNNNRPKQKPKAAAPEKQVNGEKQPNTDKQQQQAKQPANNKPANRPQQANNNKPKNAKKDNQ